MTKILRNQMIEEFAASRLAEFEAKVGKKLEPPIPIELMAERLLGLSILWEPIEELPGETIFGGIRPEERVIVMNENRRALFTEKPGLVRSTIGHEMGHWDLFVDKATLDHPMLTGFDRPDTFPLRSTPIGEVVVIARLMSSNEGRELLREMESRADDPHEARAVNRYAAAVSMPTALIRRDAMAIDRTKWPPLYRLAERYEVTISALRVRLEQLDLLFVREDKTLFESKDHAIGQGHLFG